MKLRLAWLDRLTALALVSGVSCFSQQTFLRSPGPPTYLTFGCWLFSFSVQCIVFAMQLICFRRTRRRLRAGTVQLTFWFSESDRLIRRFKSIPDTWEHEQERAALAAQASALRIRLDYEMEKFRQIQ